MTDIIFAKTRWKYDSYVDYWALVELSEFPVVWLDEMDLSKPDTIYIVSPMNGEFEPFMKGKERVSKVWLWNLERPGDDGIAGYRQGNNRYINDGILDGVIVSDRQLAKDTGFNYVPLGSHHKLGHPGSLDGRLNGFDLIHLCCYSNHRSYLFDHPNRAKNDLFGLSVAPNGWNEARHFELLASRFMLNIHQDDYRYIEPLRFSLAAAYGLPILTELCHDIYPYRYGWVMMHHDIERLLSDVWVRDKASYYSNGYLHGLTMRETMTSKFSFRNCIEMFFGG